MSRIRVIEPKVKKEIFHPVKKKNEPGTTREKDDTGKNDVAKLLAKLPNLAKSLDLHRKIGEGTFSSVYLGSPRQQAGLPDAEKTWYAVKHLVPSTHPARVAHELRCLKEIGGKNNVIGVDRCLRNLDCVVFIMPYIPHKKFSEYMHQMDTDELRRYMRALFTALRHVHSFGVIHRDVKPSNFLYDRENRRYALVDFGLAQHAYPAAWMANPPPAHQSLKRTREYDSLPEAKRMALDLSTRPRPSTVSPKSTTVLQPNVTARERADSSPPPAHTRSQYRIGCACEGISGVCSECVTWAPPRANRAGTRGFRPPEVLFKYPAQGTAVDMWASGVMLASVLSGRYPFFHSTDDMTALAEMTALLGSQALQTAALALGRRLVMSKPRSGICLRKLAVHLRGARAPPADRAPPCAGCRLHPAACVCRDPARPGHEIDPTATHVGFPDSAFALCERLLEPNPRARLTAAEALRHPFMRA